MRRVIIILGIFVLAFLLYEGCATTTYVKTAPPPSKKVVVPTVKPYPNAVWISGHWKWDPRPGKYVWVSGHWVKARKGKVWKSGHWKKTPRGWVWVRGRWGKK
jgi:hypothetical protein